MNRTLFILLLLAAGGCATPSAPLAELPVHELNLTPPQASEKLPAQPSQRVARNLELNRDESVWAAKGYRQWRYIIIHHSATEKGNAQEFDLDHRRRGWDELGYHFVIDNGNGGADGRVEVGPRWTAQKWGAHCGGTPDNEYNTHGIGICLVGDFSSRLPSPAQLESLNRLVAYLSSTCNIPSENIIGHCDAPGTRTECPGLAFHAYVLTTLRGQYAGR